MNDVRRALRLRTLFAVGVVLTLALGIALYRLWFLDNFRPVERTITTGFKGKARTDPYYVLQQLLRELGMDVKRSTGFPDPLEASSVVFWLRPTDEGEGAMLAAWADAGGHVVFAFEPWPGFLDLNAPMERSTGPWSLSNLNAQQWTRQSGCVSVLASASDLDNQSLAREPERAVMLERLLSCAGPWERAYIVAEPAWPSLIALLWQHAAPALIALGVLLATFVWSRSLRFGPVLPAPALARRSLLEHVSAVGQLAFRTRSLDALVSRARTAVRRRLSARVPGSSELQGEALVQAVARATDRSEGEIRKALLSPAPREASALAATVRALQALWSSR